MTGKERRTEGCLYFQAENELLMSGNDPALLCRDRRGDEKPVETK